MISLAPCKAYTFRLSIEGRNRKLGNSLPKGITHSKIISAENQRYFPENTADSRSSPIRGRPSPTTPSPHEITSLETPETRETVSLFTLNVSDTSETPGTPGTPGTPDTLDTLDTLET